MHGPVEAVLDAALREPESAVLESQLRAGGQGRYSFACTRPFMTFRSRGPRIEISCAGATEVLEGDPLAELASLLRRCVVPHCEPSRIPFQGGAVGWITYDLCRALERIPSKAADDLKLPDIRLNFYDSVFAHDSATGEAFTFASRPRDPRIAAGLPGPEDAAERWRTTAENAWASCVGPGIPPPPRRAFENPRLRSNFSREEYLRAVERVRRYIVDGDIFQANLSQRFEMPFRAGLRRLYRLLRATNPAPFAAALNFDEAKVACSSPERYLSVRGGTAEIRPIKGTRPRGQTLIEDEALARELRSSPKDLAENTMIVDLVRNDLGRVCEFGSVKVVELAALETFPTVFHLTSTVRGSLRPGVDRLDAVRASFPDGSITGAPKVRAMEIIEELEPVRRGLYTGSVGYFSFSGPADLNVAIRTVVLRRGRAYFGVGGGIVYDSDPEAEYMETLHKGGALAEALVSLSAGARSGVRIP